MVINMNEGQKTEDAPVWAKPNNFILSIRCTRTDYAKNFVEKGELKFNTPQSWVDWELSNGRGRGDLCEGTIAYCHILDTERVVEFGERYKSDKYTAMRIEQKIYLKRKRTMSLPVFCFYILKNSLFQCPLKEGKQKMEVEIDSIYFKDFADNVTPEQVDNLLDEEKPAVILLHNYDEFMNRLTKKLLSMGLQEKEIVPGDIKYYDSNEHGEEGWRVFEGEPPKELFAKDKSFCHQSEARIIINTDNQSIINKLLKQPIEIGSLSDISEYISAYFSEGAKIEVNANIEKLEE